MWALRVFLVIALAFGLTACGSKFKTYNGSEVTRVEVHKSDRKMYLLHNAEVLKVYDISLGFQPRGHKQFERDGKTPEGSYTITHRNPRSSYHLSLGISYPNGADLRAVPGSTALTSALARVTGPTALAGALA